MIESSVFQGLLPCCVCVCVCVCLDVVVIFASVLLIYGCQVCVCGEEPKIWIPQFFFSCGLEFGNWEEKKKNKPGIGEMNEIKQKKKCVMYVQTCEYCLVFSWLGALLWLYGWFWLDDLCFKNLKLSLIPLLNFAVKPFLCCCCCWLCWLWWLWWLWWLGCGWACTNIISQLLKKRSVHWVAYN